MRFASFAEFYPYYLSEHQDRTCRRLHFVGSWLALLCTGLALGTWNGWWSRCQKVYRDCFWHLNEGIRAPVATCRRTAAQGDDVVA